MNRLQQYGGRMIETDGRPTIELVDPNDNAQQRFQYRRSGDGIERRVLAHDGRAMRDGSPWERMTASEVFAMVQIRGQYHPILDPLGL